MKYERNIGETNIAALLRAREEGRHYNRPTTDKCVEIAGRTVYYTVTKNAVYANLYMKKPERGSREAGIARVPHKFVARYSRGEIRNEEDELALVRFAILCGETEGREYDYL